MTAPDELKPATADEVTQAISFALRYEGRKRVHQADEMMALITAERLIRHLERAGYVGMKKPPLPSHTAPYGSGT